MSNWIQVSVAERGRAIKGRWQQMRASAWVRQVTEGKQKHNKVQRSWFLYKNILFSQDNLGVFKMVFNLIVLNHQWSFIQDVVAPNSNNCPHYLTRFVFFYKIWYFVEFPFNLTMWTSHQMTSHATNTPQPLSLYPQQQHQCMCLSHFSCIGSYLQHMYLHTPVLITDFNQEQSCFVMLL